MDETESFFSFLDGINSDYIGFGGGVIFFILFLFVNKNYASLVFNIFFGGFIYLLSLGIAIGLQGIIEDRTSAFVAGFGNPLVLFTLASLWFRYTYKAPKEAPSNYDHLIDN